jgi:hypothetical protein
VQAFTVTLRRIVHLDAGGIVQAMTPWQALQWVLAGLAAVSGTVGIAWIVVQARRLHRDERDRAQLEEAAIALIDWLAESTTFQEVKPAHRRAAALAEQWGALVTTWDRGRMLARPRRAAIDG